MKMSGWNFSGVRTGQALLAGFVWLACSTSGTAALETGRIANTGLFGIQTGSGGEFYGRVQSINSISLQYYRTAVFKVTEIVIDMAGSPLQLRIYHVHPLTPGDLPETRTGFVPVPREASPRVPAALRRAADEMAVEDLLLFKEYPVTTHAKTIELIVRNRQDLLDLFEELKKRWVQRPSRPQESAAREADAMGLHGVVFSVP